MLISVITPTYNRAQLLPRLFESLCCQTLKDFEWIIVDDGSTDETGEVVKSFELRVKSFDGGQNFPVKYMHKQNGGKHTAVNLGVKEARGELIFIVDSDDWLPNDAIAVVAQEWEKVKDRPNIGGLSGLDMKPDGTIIGSGLPHSTIDCNAIDIRYRYHVTGDLKEVFRASVLREFPFPEIKNERFCPEQLCWFRIARKYDLHYFNRFIYYADYQENGITAGITRARMQSPVASMMTYAEMLPLNIPLKAKVKAAINYWRFWWADKDGSRESSVVSRESSVVSRESSAFSREMEDVGWQKTQNSKLKNQNLSWPWHLLMPLGWLMHKRDLSREL